MNNILTQITYACRATVIFAMGFMFCACNEDVGYNETRTYLPQPSSNPILVTIDTNAVQTNIEPGYGLGVFVQYAAGGRWTVQWTCDVLWSESPCPWNFTIVGPVVSNVVPIGSITPSTADAGSSQTAITVTTQQISDLEGVSFSTEPGAWITITAALGNSYNPANFYFVQDGKQQGGGYPVLTDPVSFVGSSP